MRVSQGVWCSSEHHAFPSLWITTFTYVAINLLLLQTFATVIVYSVRLLNLSFIFGFPISGLHCTNMKEILFVTLECPVLSAHTSLNVHRCITHPYNQHPSQDRIFLACHFAILTPPNINSSLKQLLWTYLHVTCFIYLPIHKVSYLRGTPLLDSSSTSYSE